MSAPLAQAAATLGEASFWLSAAEIEIARAIAANEAALRDLRSMRTSVEMARIAADALRRCVEADRADWDAMPPPAAAEIRQEMGA